MQTFSIVAGALKLSYALGRRSHQAVAEWGLSGYFRTPSLDRFTVWNCGSPSSSYHTIAASGEKRGEANVDCETVDFAYIAVSSHLLESGYDIRTEPELLGDKAVSATMI